MSISSSNDAEKRLAEYRRAMLRGSLVSLFWAVIEHKRETTKYTMSALAKKIGRDKSALSRWFSDERPNWTADTVADIAGALGVEISISARDRSTGAIFTPQGLVSSSTGTLPPTFRQVPPNPGSKPPMTRIDIKSLPRGSDVVTPGV